MLCKPKNSITFRVYEVGQDNTTLHDLNKEITIVSPDDTRIFWKEYYRSADRGLDDFSIASAIIRKTYGFNKYVNGYQVRWTKDPMLEGHIDDSYGRRIWYIKRVI